MKWSVEEDLTSDDFKQGYAWYIIEGTVITTTYFLDDKELFWELKEGTWTGLPDALLNTIPEYDLKVLRGTKILEIPIYDILQTNEIPKNFYKKILVEFANTVKPAVKNATARLRFSDEMFFLKHLENNNYKVTFISLKDLAELLNINLRTFHRIIKKLMLNNIITKESDSIEVVDPSKIDEYISKISN